MVIRVPTGQFFAGGQARGQIARGQLGVQQQQVGIQQESLQLAQQKQQEAQFKGLADNARKNAQLIEEDIKGVLVELKKAEALPDDNPNKVKIITALQSAVSRAVATGGENLERVQGITGIDLRLEGTRLQNLGRKISGISLREEAVVAGGIAAGEAVAKQRELATAGLTPGQVAAAGGPAVVEPRAPNPQNFVNTTTGQNISVDLNAPNASEQIQNLLKQGFTRAGITVTGAPSEFELEPKEVVQLRDTVFATSSVISSLNRIRQITSTGDFVGGLSGPVVRTVANAAAEARNLGKIFGIDVADSVAIIDSYDLTGFATTSAAFRSNVISLAIDMALAAERGGRLSDQDVQRQLDVLSANSADISQLNASFNEIEIKTKQRLLDFAKSRQIGTGVDLVSQIPPELLPAGIEKPGLVIKRFTAEGVPLQ